MVRKVKRSPRLHNVKSERTKKISAPLKANKVRARAIKKQQTKKCEMSRAKNSPLKTQTGGVGPITRLRAKIIKAEQKRDRARATREHYKLLGKYQRSLKTPVRMSTGGRLPIHSVDKHQRKPVGCCCFKKKKIKVENHPINFPKPKSGQMKNPYSILQPQQEKGKKNKKQKPTKSQSAIVSKNTKKIKVENNPTEVPEPKRRIYIRSTKCNTPLPNGLNSTPIKTEMVKEDNESTSTSAQWWDAIDVKTEPNW